MPNPKLKGRPNVRLNRFMEEYCRNAMPRLGVGPKEWSKTLEILLRERAEALYMIQDLIAERDAALAAVAIEKNNAAAIAGIAYATGKDLGAVTVHVDAEGNHAALLVGKGKDAAVVGGLDVGAIRRDVLAEMEEPREDLPPFAETEEVERTRELILGPLEAH